MTKQKEANDLISTLKETRSVPLVETYLRDYTIGSYFQGRLEKIYQEVESNPTHLTRIVRGTPGVGKTHLLRSLQLKLQDLSDVDDTLVIWVNMRHLGDLNDLQLLFIHGLTDVYSMEANNHRQILKQVYQRIKTRIDSVNHTSFNTLQVIRVLLIYLHDYPQHVETNNTLEEWINGATFAQLMKQQQKPEWVKQDSQAFPENFVEQFIALGENNNLNFDDEITHIAHQTKFDTLVDLYFRILYLAEFKRVVMLIDEMEIINTQTLVETEPILNVFFRLHEQLGHQRQYPAIAQIMAMPNDLLVDATRIHDQALYSRWSKTDIPVKTLEKDDKATDALIKMLYKLCLQAGYVLRRKLSRDDIATIKRIIYSRLDAYDVLDDRLSTMRNLIYELLKLYEEQHENNQKRRRG